MLKLQVKPSSYSNRRRISLWGESEKVVLLVDGKRFMISPHLLMSHPNTMLGRSVGPRHTPQVVALSTSHDACSEIALCVHLAVPSLDGRQPLLT